VRSVFFYKPDPIELQRAHRAPARWSVWVWLPAAIAVVCIALESTGTFSSANTSRHLRPVIEKIFGAMDDLAWDSLHHHIRKTGHFLGYGLVCLTFLRGWLLNLGMRADLNYKSWRFRSCIAAIVSTALVASADEIHQTFLPSRTGRFADVVLDTCGGATFCLLMWLVCWRRRTWETAL
jgi:VanZ family protein